MDILPLEDRELSRQGEGDIIWRNATPLLGTTKDGSDSGSFSDDVRTVYFYFVVKRGNWIRQDGYFPS